MSFTLELNSITNDLVINNGKFKKISGADEVRQRVRVALKHYKEEYFLNVLNGLPWYKQMLGMKGSHTYLSNVIRKKILEVPGVVRILEFNLTYNGATREYTPYAKIVVERGAGDQIDYLTIDGIYVEA